uniref:Deoxyuridine 5'-triphosphate nucleotidohydrolase n=1 Tax=Erpetoichthys calabaricus TaxID=27687 RepID=A0A8C4RMP3_ERPCA
MWEQIWEIAANNPNITVSHVDAHTKGTDAEALFNAVADAQTKTATVTIMEHGTDMAKWAHERGGHLGAAATVKWAHPDAKLPIRGSEGAAGLDLYAIQDETVTERVTIINTGIGVKIPKGHYGHVCPRSSLALKGVTVLAGVIDADYQGTVKVLLQSSMGDPIKLTKGDRIAQLLIIPVHMGKVQESTAPVVKTGRNVGGFGSTDNPHNKTVTCRTNN